MSYTEEVASEFRPRRNNGSNSTGIKFQLPESADSEPDKPRFNWIDSATFNSASYPLNYLIEGVLVEKQGCLLGGPAKSLKTSVALELALSLGTGTPFLGHYKVPSAVRVAVLSGESGERTLQETVRRIARAKGVDLASAKLLWGFDPLPKIGSLQDVDYLTGMIIDHEVDVLLIDPLYLCLLDRSQASEASNVFMMGTHLEILSAITQKTGCTIVALHHTKKHREKEPIDLYDLSMSGFAEWARQWILINRRETYEPGTGLHQLWLSLGGSAGHSDLWALDVNEGTPDAYGGRLWSLSMTRGSEAKQAAQDEADRKKEDFKRQAENARQAKILDQLRENPGGLTKSDISHRAGINNGNTNSAVQELLGSKEIEPCKVTKNGKQYDGFKLSTPTTPTGHPDNLSVGLADHDNDTPPL